jgi:cell division protein FtsB
MRQSFRLRFPDLDLPGTSILQALLVIILTLNLVLFHAIFFSDRGLPGYRQQNRQVEELAAKVGTLRQQNRRTFNRIQALKNDPRSLEKIVRQELGWARPNELLFEFVPPARPAAP